MPPEGFPLAATVILLLPMAYFFMTTPTFFFMKFDNPSVSWVMRALFNTYFIILSIAGVIATLAFARAGQLAFAVGFGLIAAFAVWARRWFLRQIDAQISARDAGDADTARRLRRLHLSGMAYNAVQLVALVAGIPYVFNMAA